MSKIEDAVASKLLDRAEIGKKKYGVTMERDDLTLLEWLNHLQEEVMDAAVYIEKLMTVVKNSELDGKKVTEESKRSLEQQYSDKLEEK